MTEARAQGGISWSYYRLANADNGVTGEEQQAITAFPFWQRFSAGGIATKALIALPDQPVAYYREGLRNQMKTFFRRLAVPPGLRHKGVVVPALAVLGMLIDAGLWLLGHAGPNS